MVSDKERAVSILHSGNYTCVICKDGTEYTSTERGIKPLLQWLDCGLKLDGFCAADKVVGKAAAFLYILLGVSNVYADVMSKAAANVLEQNGISASAAAYTEQIINRSGTSLCPMEQTVMNINDPIQALEAVRQKLSELKKEQK